LIFRLLLTAMLLPRCWTFDVSVSPNPFANQVGKVKTAPSRMPVGQRLVTVFKRV